jgi:4-carboxymuconolactone decarboxylase
MRRRVFSYECSGEGMTDYAPIGRKKTARSDREAGVSVEETLNGICPDLARYPIEHSFGEIYAREAPGNKT